MKVIGPKGLHGGSVEDYIARDRDILEKDGFFEHELGRRLEVWGGLATAWSSYDGHTADGSFHERGINSFQLVKVDGKWLVASSLWQEVTPETCRCRMISKIRSESGGQGEIRTHEPLARSPHFECGAFNHSTTCPRWRIRYLS